MDLRLVLNKCKAIRVSANDAFIKPRSKSNLSINRVVIFYKTLLFPGFVIDLVDVYQWSGRRDSSGG